MNMDGGERSDGKTVAIYISVCVLCCGGQAGVRSVDSANSTADHGEEGERCQNHSPAAPNVIAPPPLPHLHLPHVVFYTAIWAI